MDKRSVYLDHQTTTPVLEEALQAMLPYFREAYGAPSSLHRFGLQVREGIATARAQLAALINAESPDDLILTSGGTEAANLAIKGFAEANTKRKGNHFVVAATEHPAILNSIEFLAKHGFEVTQVPVDNVGRINPEDVRAAITDKTLLIGVHLVNHDIGTIQPIKEIGKIAAEKGISLYCDALAAAGWLPIDVQELGVHLLSFSPHRFYGPKGVGVLYRNRKARVTSLIHGGVQENGRRAGTENVPDIVGAGVAAEVALREMPQRIAHVSALQKRLYDGLFSTIKFLKLNGPVPRPGSNLHAAQSLDRVHRGRGPAAPARPRRHRGGQRLELREQVAQGLARALGHPARPRTRAGQHHHEPGQGQHERGRRLRRRALRCGRNLRRA